MSLMLFAKSNTSYLTIVFIYNNIMFMTLEDGLYQVSGGSRILKSGVLVCTLSWVQCNKVAPMKKIEIV